MADCTPAPEGDALQLALTSLNGITASILVEEIAGAGEGDWLIQNGTNSSCGRFVIALAKAKASSRQKLQAPSRWSRRRRPLRYRQRQAASARARL